MAATNRAVATGRDTSGKLANDFDKEAVQAELAIVSAFVKLASPFAGKMAGRCSKARQERAQQEATSCRLARYTKTWGLSRLLTVPG